MKKVKLLGLAAVALTAAAGAVSCGGSRADLIVWAPQEHQALYQQFIEDFKKANPEYAEMNIQLGVSSEADAYGNVSKSPQDAADVYTFANDQLYNLINIGALSEIGGTYKTDVETKNSEGIVNAAKQGDKLYAFPISSDNGYFLYLNKSIVTEYNESSTFFDVLDQCAAKDKNFGVTMGDSWYGYGFFSGFGAKYEVEYNEDGTEKSIKTDYNGEKGLKTAEFLNDVAGHEAFQYLDGGASKETSVILNNFIQGSLPTEEDLEKNPDAKPIPSRVNELGAFIGGTWLYDAVASDANWGKENTVCTYLPLMEKGNADTRMRSFIGGKMIGVNGYAQNKDLAYDFAAFISNYDAQMARFEELGMGPSNLEALAQPEVEDNVALQGLAAQVDKAGDAQINVPSTFWNALQNFGVYVGFNEGYGTRTTEELQNALNTLVSSMTTLK